VTVAPDRREQLIVSRSPAETEAFGRELGRRLQTGDVVLLYGELGSGKTVLCKGLAEGVCGIEPRAVTSPTYVLVHRYGQERTLFHVDLYRLDKPEEVSALALEELLELGPMVIEWGEKAEGLTLPVRYRIWIEITGPEGRTIRLAELDPGT